MIIDTGLFFEKHPFLGAIVNIIRRRHDGVFLTVVSGKNRLFAPVVSGGRELIGTNVYYIVLGEKELGFCALLRRTLLYLAYADRYGYVPYVKWEKCIPYYDAEYEENPFENYFIQSSGLNESVVLKCYNLFLSEKNHEYSSFIDDEPGVEVNGYYVNDEYIQRLALIADRYLVLNKTTEKYIVEGENKLNVDWSNCLGVHIRGTDFKVGYDEHPICISERDYFDRIDNIIGSKHYTSIFLATDDIELYEAFKSKYGEVVVSFEDTYRGCGNISVAFSEVERKHHNYFLGLELLRDVYLLAKCKGIISGISQVSIMARVIAKSKNNYYLDDIVIDKGISTNHKLKFKTPIV